MIKAIFSFALAIASSCAFADGVPLITAGPPVPAAAAKQMADRVDFVKAHGIVLNKNAFVANVLTVTVDGVEHRFVGGVVPAIPMSARPGMFKDSGQPDSWRGSEPGAVGSLLSLTRQADGAVTGVMELWPTRRFDIQPGVMYETDTARAPRMQHLPAPPAPPTSGALK